MEEEAKYLDYNGLVLYHRNAQIQRLEDINNLENKMYVPTINSIPTKTTLSYVRNSKVYWYDIGDFVRVVDDTKSTGYKFYQLYDITNLGEAIWNAYAEKTSSTYIPPTANSLTYNGEEQEVFTAGSTGNGIIKYSSDGVTWSTEVPTIQNVGNYTFYWKLEGDELHSDVQPTAISVTMIKVTPTYTNPTANNLTYNENPQELITPGETDFGTFQYSTDQVSWSTEIPKGTNSGQYTIYYRVLGNENINTTETLSINITIAPKELQNPTMTLSQIEYTYDGNACEPSIVIKDGDTIIPLSEYTVSYINNINAGTATLIITDNVGGNYTINNSVDFTINKASGSVGTIPTNRAVTYNALAQPLATEGSGTGVMYYSLKENSGYSTSIPTQTNAGTYTLYYYAAESANYLQSAKGHIEVTIAKANPSYESSTIKEGLIYNGLAQALVNKGTTPDGTMKYSLNGTDWSTNVPTGVNAVTYYPKWKIFGDANHNDTEPVELTVSIAKVTPIVTAPVAKTTLVYSAEAQQLVNAGSTNFGTLQYTTSENGQFSTIIPTGTNAGTYYVWYRVLGDSNINDVPPEQLTITIAKANPSYVAPTTKTGLVYSGEAQLLLNQGSTADGEMQYSKDNSNWSTSVPKETNAGTYTSYWRIVGDSNHNDKASVSISTTIDKAAGKVTTAPTAKSLTYNGTAQTLINAGAGTGTMQYKVNSGSWSSSIPTATDATTYTVYYKAIESSNYYATSGNDSISVTINKVTPSVTAPTAKVLTYNTGAQELVNAGSTNWGTLQYSLDNSTWSTSIPKATNYGSYTVYYRVVGNSNINDVASKSVACSIAEKRVSSPTIELSPSSYTYNGTARTPSVTVKDGSTTIPASEYSVTYSNNTNAGTATVTISDNAYGNYNITGSTTFPIAKASGSVSSAPTAKSLTYNGNSQQLINAGSGTGTMYYKLGSGSWGTGIPSATAAGTYTVYYYAAESSNYNQSGTGEVSITISKVTPSVTAPTKKTLSYTGNSQVLANAGSTNWGTMQYSLDNSSYSTSVPSGIGAGNYTLYYRVVGDSNINDWGPSSIACSISKVAPSYTAPTATSPTYNGNNQSLLNAGSTSHGTIYYSSDNSSWGTSIPTGNSAGGYTSYWKLVGDSNHTDIGSTSIGTTIAKANPSYTAPVNNNPTYTGGDVYLLTSGSTSHGTIQFSSDNSSWSTSRPTAVNAGSYTRYWRLIGDANHNNVSSQSVSCSIAQAAMSGSAPTAKSLTYNGSAQTLANAGSASGGSIQYSLNQSSWSDTIPSQTNAGSWDLYYRFVPDSNHYVISGGSISVSIEKASGSAYATANGWTYDGNSRDVIYNTGGYGKLQYQLEGGSWQTSIPTAVNAGSYNCRVYSPGDGNHYEAYSGWYTCTVNKASGSASCSAKSLTYNGSSQTLANAGSGTGTIYYSLTNSNFSTTIPAQTDAGSWTLYYYAAASANYNQSTTYTVSVGISKASGSAYATANGWTYNGNSYGVIYNAGGYGSLQYRLEGGSWGTSIPSAINAGTYKCQVYSSGDANHNEAYSDWYTCTVSKASNSISAYGNSWTYDGNAHNVIYSVSGYGSFQYRLEGGSWGTTIPTATNAGTYKCQVYASGDSNHNDGYSDWYTCTVSKAAGSVYATGNSWTYNGNSYGMVYNAGGYGTLQYQAQGGSWSTSIPTAINAGTYYCRVYSPGDANHNESTSDWYTCTVSKANGYASVSGRSLTYNGNAQYLIDVSGNTGTMHYSVDYSNWYTDKPTATNVGSWTVYWYMDASDNYNGIGADGGRYVSSSISKINPTITAYPTNAGRTYNGSDQYLLTGGTANVSGSFSYSTGKNAGSYTATWWFTPSDTTNYNSLSGTVSASIAKASGYCVISEPYRPSYTGSPIRIGNISGSGTTYYKINSGSYTQGSEVYATNAGGYTITAYAAESDNYNQSSETSTTVYISRLDRTISFSSAPASVVKGQSIQVSAYPSAGSGDGTITYSSSDTSKAIVSGNTVTGVGVGTVTITAIISQGTNYNSASTSYSLTIEDDMLVEMSLPSGIKWATKNLGATVDTDEGNYYAYGWKEPHDSSYAFSNRDYNSSNNGYTWNSITDQNPAEELGTGWGVPSESDWQELVENSTRTRIIKNGVYCTKYVSKINGEELIFPDVHNISDGTSNTNNQYWTETPGSFSGFCKCADSQDGAISQIPAYCGLPIRACKW